MDFKKLSKPTSHPGWQFVRYCISGTSATLADFFILWCCTSVFGWHYQVGVFIGYAVSLAITFTLSSFWIFDQHRLQNRMAELLGFATIGGLGILMTHLWMWLFTEQWFGMDQYMFSKVVTVMLVAIQNYILRKFILYSK